MGARRKPETTPADRLRAALAARNLSPTEAAAKLGVKRESLTQYLSGDRAPTLNWLWNFAEKIGVDPAGLDARLASTVSKAP